MILERQLTKEDEAVIDTMETQFKKEMAIIALTSKMNHDQIRRCVSALIESSNLCEELKVKVDSWEAIIGKEHLDNCTVEDHIRVKKSYHRTKKHVKYLKLLIEVQNEFNSF